MLEAGQINKICIMEDSLDHADYEKWKQKCGLGPRQRKASSNRSARFDSRGRVSCPFCWTSFLPSVLSFPGNRKQSMFTLMMQIPSMQLLHTVFPVSTISLHSFHSWRSLGGSVSVPSTPWNTMKQSRLNCGRRHVPPASLQPHPVS